MRRWLVLTVIVLMAAGLVRAQDSWQVTATRQMNLSMPVGAAAAYAPGGSSLAFLDFNNRLTLVTFDGDEIIPLAEDLPPPTDGEGDATPAGSVLRWSPDGRYLSIMNRVPVYGERVGGLFQPTEGDVVLYDRQTAAFVNLTADGVSEVDDRQSYDHDYAALWQPGSGDLYFLRASVVSGALLRIGLYRLRREAPTGSLVVGAPERVALLTSLLTDAQRLWRDEDSMEGSGAFSPDGRWLAILTTEQVEGRAATTITVVEAETGAFRTVLTPVELNRAPGLAEWMPLALQPTALGWAADDALIVEGRMIVADDTLINLYRLDVTSGALTPLFDYSAASSAERLMTPNQFGVETPTVDDMPQLSLLTPDGTALLYVAGSRLARWWALPLAVGATPQQIEGEGLDWSRPEFNQMPVIVQRGAQVTLLFGYLELTLRRGGG